MEINDKVYQFYSPQKNNFSEDSYINEIRSKLRSMRSERKEAEREAKQMSIRLASLKNENKSNWNEIKKTKQKTKAKSKYLEQFINLREIKQKRKEEKEMEIQKQKERNKLLRESISDPQKKEEYLMEKTEKALLLKLQKEYNRELSIYLKNVELAKKREKADAVKERMSSIKENKIKQMMKKKKDIQKELEDQLIDEYNKLELIEKQKTQIENEGNEILRQIEQSNKIKNAYQNKLHMLSLDQLYYNKDNDQMFGMSNNSNSIL